MIRHSGMGATYHPWTPGSRSLCGHCSFASRDPRRPLRCSGSLPARPHWCAVELMALQRQAPGHLGWGDRDACGGHPQPWRRPTARGCPCSPPAVMACEAQEVPRQTEGRAPPGQRGRAGALGARKSPQHLEPLQALCPVPAPTPPCAELLQLGSGAGRAYPGRPQGPGPPLSPGPGPPGLGLEESAWGPCRPAAASGGLLPPACTAPSAAAPAALLSKNRRKESGGQVGAVCRCEHLGSPWRPGPQEHTCGCPRVPRPATAIPWLRGPQGRLPPPGPQAAEPPPRAH